MDENRLSGTAKNLGGKVEEAFGRATGDAKTQVRGQMHQAEGSVQDLYGQAETPPGRLSTQWGRCRPPWKTPFATTSKIDRIRPLPSL